MGYPIYVKIKKKKNGWMSYCPAKFNEDLIQITDLTLNSPAECFSSYLYIKNTEWRVIYYDHTPKCFTSLKCASIWENKVVA